MILRTVHFLYLNKPTERYRSENTEGDFWRTESENSSQVWTESVMISASIFKSPI